MFQGELMSEIGEDAINIISRHRRNSSPSQRHLAPDEYIYHHPLIVNHSSSVGSNYADGLRLITEGREGKWCLWDGAQRHARRMAET